MKENTDYTTQDLVTSSETLLEDVDVAEQIMVEPPTEAMELKVRSEILKRFMVEEEDYARDGYVEIMVCADEMEATADFIAPTGGGQMLDRMRYRGPWKPEGSSSEPIGRRSRKLCFAATPRESTPWM
jgi:hypothetical protein